MSGPQAQDGLEPLAASACGVGVRAWVEGVSAAVSNVGAGHDGAPELPAMAIPTGEATHVPHIQGRS